MKGPNRGAHHQPIRPKSETGDSMRSHRNVLLLSLKSHTSRIGASLFGLIRDLLSSGRAWQRSVHERCAETCFWREL